MFFWWGPGWGWVAGLINLAILIAIIVIAVQLIRGELPGLQQRMGRSPALKLLEERYARGEVSREEFLERRAVLLRSAAAYGSTPPGQTPAPGPPGSPAAPTEPLPPPPPSS